MTETPEEVATLLRPSQTHQLAFCCLAQRCRVNPRLLETEMSPHLFLELPKKPKSKKFTTWPALPSNNCYLQAQISRPDSRGYRKVSVIDFQPLHSKEPRGTQWREMWPRGTGGEVEKKEVITSPASQETKASALYSSSSLQEPAMEVLSPPLF